MDDKALWQLLEPTVAGLGYELVNLEYRRGRSGLLRLFIDRPEGIGLGDCEKVSEQISALLDVEDPIPGEYSLEVSSPGADRVLRTPAHFERFAGERVRVVLKVPRDGRRRFTGTLSGIDDDTIEMQVDGETVSLALNLIERAQLAPLI